MIEWFDDSVYKAATVLRDEWVFLTVDDDLLSLMTLSGSLPSKPAQKANAATHEKFQITDTHKWILNALGTGI